MYAKEKFNWIITRSKTQSIGGTYPVKTRQKSIQHKLTKRPEVKDTDSGKYSGTDSRMNSADEVRYEEIIEMECLRLSSDGSGVGYDKGKATFVPGLLPGEIGQVQIVEEKKTWQRGKLLSLTKESNERLEAPCTVFNICGGCQLQHLRYDQTLEWKRRWVEDSLSRIGKVSLEKVTVYPTMGMDFPWRYRNKARIHRGKKNLGYYQEKSNSTVRFSDCLLISEPMNQRVSEAERVLHTLLDKGVADTIRSLTFRENTKGEGMLILDSIPGEEGKKELLKSDLLNWLQSEQLNKKSMIQSVWGLNPQGKPEILLGQDDFREELLGFKFKISPLAFLQVNPIQTQKLYNKVLEYADLSKNQVVWDLYSGIGTITLALAAKSKKVWGIEENPYAVEDAKVNANFNQVSNVEFIAGKVEDTFLQISERPDIVVLDPPRAGAHRKVLERLIELKPKRIIYVSCDPGTLGRDLGILQAGGYSVSKVQPVDMFPWTQHVETIVLMSRKDK
jgi:23S rRNA (uracil1939-C5)-methyltransferase